MMASPPETTLDLERKECATASGYLWYTCTFTTPWYAGCCSVNPCQQQPVGCPLIAQGEPVTSTQSTSLSSTPSEITTTLTPTADISSRTTLSTSTYPTNYEDSHGMKISISALVGVVVGCAIAVIFVALVSCMWWGRRRREKDEKRDQAQRLASPRVVDEELVPPGLEGVFNPMASNGRGSIFDRAEGRMSKISHESGSFPNLPLRDSCMSGGAHSNLASPLRKPDPRDRLPGDSQSQLVSPPSSNTPNNPECPPISVELDSTSIKELPVPAPQHGELESPQPYDSPEPTEGPRATLNSTQQERQSNTYVNSWTRFQNVQV
ncbi:hypothetical protein B0T21DRAFT_170745 [Apiosordaria backusii]|uniref:Uncharacterized protein n=1 Tax=Apiosordaria backusii TaxID=314023 RepID=A0AA40EH81_9PEZI|nr:hypothetical protein B0T21DRAFT_170745 [Apiosordaria backusii]